MNPQQQSQFLTITQIDNELIFDLNHILMNYLKMNSFSGNCFSGTNIQISPTIMSSTFPQEEIKKYNQFSTKYFTLFLNYENAIDILSPLISTYSNSEFGLFLATILNKHMIEKAQSLDDSNEKFEKYKNYLLNIYHAILHIKNNHKLLESICSSITVLIIVGINGNWRNGLEQLIGAAKENNGGDFGNILMASLIISNINNIFEKIRTKLPLKNKENISGYIKGYSNLIQEFSNFLITGAFNGPKENFVNTTLFKAFIGIVQSFKYFGINIIKIHGFADFLINCISYIDINQDLILQICDIFEYTFSDKNNIGLIFEYKPGGYTMEYLVAFLNNISNHKDFQEIKSCIELIKNVKNYYSNKDIKEIKSNQKDIQILFASCSILSNLCENFGYIFFLPELDVIVQELYYYFINLPLYTISQILFNSLSQIVYLIHHGYKFNNFNNGSNLCNMKLQNFNIFLYNIHNSVFQNMKIASMEEYNNINFSSFPFYCTGKLIKYINELLKESISDDEKINYIIGANDFYDNLYQIINDLYGIKDFTTKLCQYLMNAVNSKDLLSIDCILLVFNKIGSNLSIDLPEIIFYLIDFLLNDNNNLNTNLLNDARFTLQFIKLMIIMINPISNKKKYLNIIIPNLLKQKYPEEKMNIVIINFIFKLLSTSYQIFKLNNQTISNIDDDKDSLMNVFNILSKYLIDNISLLPYNYLMKLIDCIFTSCFYNIYLGYLSNNVIFNISEKLFKDANQIFNMTVNSNINKNNLYIKYIHMVFSIIKNIANENSELLLELYNKKDLNPNNVNLPSNNNSISYFDNIQNNIIIIINECSENSQNFDQNTINSIVCLYNIMIKPLKEKTKTYYNIISNTISTIIKLNPGNFKEIELTITLNKNILNHCKTSSISIEIIEKCFDFLNIFNQKFDLAKKDEDKILLSIKVCEFILLYFPNYSKNFEQICNKLSQQNCIFTYSFNELINTFESNNSEEYNYIFANFIKTLCENDYIFRGFIKDYIIRLTSTFINHLQMFKTDTNKCIPYYFMIFKYFYSGAKELFCNSLKRIFVNNNEIIYVIEMYLDNIQYTNYNNLEIKVKNYNKSFIKELGELLYAIDTKKSEFVNKYLRFVDEMKKEERKGTFDNNCEKSITQISLIHK